MRIAQKDDIAFAALYHVMAKPLYAVAVNIVHDAYLAEDVVHDAMLHIRAAAERFENGRNAKAWMYAITRNVALTAFKRSRRDDVTEEMVLEQVGVSDFAENCEWMITLEKLLFDLPLEDREIVVLHVVNGLKFREIAELLGKPLGTVLWRYRVVMNLLKKQLQD